MVDRVDITDAAVRDLLFLVSHLEEADRVVRESTQLADVPATFKELYDRLSPDAPKDSRRIVRSLSNIRDFIENAKTTPEETLDLLTDALDRKHSAGWPEASRAEWTNARARIIGLLALIDDRHPFVLLQKASDLTYAHEKVFRDARIITDLRPVFWGDSDQVARGIAIHKLLIEFSIGGTAERVEFALDAADVANLRKLCQRAESKASALVRSLAPIWPVVVPRAKDAQ
jgi:hypothetical protein